jgi:hypothetical protein
MADDEIERAVARYRPAAPSPALRARVLAIAGPNRRLERRVVLMTLAATIVAAVALALTSDTYRDLQSIASARADESRARAAEIRETVAVLGGDATSASRIIELDQAARAEAEDAARRLNAGGQ